MLLARTLVLPRRPERDQIAFRKRKARRRSDENEERQPAALQKPAVSTTITTNVAHDASRGGSAVIRKRAGPARPGINKRRLA
jgi:hypothetical protein